MNVFGAEKSKNKKLLVLAGWGIPLLFAIPWIVLVDRRYEIDHSNHRQEFLNSSSELKIQIFIMVIFNTKYYQLSNFSTILLGVLWDLDRNL